MQTAFGIVFLLCLSVFLVSCGKQNTYNTNAARQNSIAAFEKAKELRPAIGKYCGLMHLLKSDTDFDVELELHRGDDNIHASTSQNPVDTVQVPKLAGYMQFPAIENQGSAAYMTLPLLMEATGGYRAISFTFGDYDPLTQRIYLPFLVPGHTQGNYGEMRGTLNLATSRFAGVWYSNSYEELGAFDLPRCWNRI